MKENFKTFYKEANN